MGYKGAMELTVQHDCFATEAEALAAAEAAGYHTVTLDFDEVNPHEHWHDFEAATYVVAGEITITVSETGETCTLRPGSVITAPGRMLHREESAGFRAVIGLTQDPATIELPIGRKPEDLPV